MIAVLTVLAPVITFQSLVRELSDPDNLSRWPEPTYQSLQASSYNRESTRRDQPTWFADSDGTGFIRQDGEDFVLMEHSGPGVITKIWTPFFYYDFNDRVGPDVQITLDGKTVINESMIKLVTGKGTVGAPWAAHSARAGNLYLPMPFARSAKITMKKRPFYFLINYRAYPAGTKVESYDQNIAKLVKPNLKLDDLPVALTELNLRPGEAKVMTLPNGPSAVDQLVVKLRETKPSQLRTTLLSATFDGIETISCPLGDFFCSADSIHPFTTLTRSVDKEERMVSRWLMPYQKSATVTLTNLSREPVALAYSVSVRKNKWDNRTMHFYARWRPDDIVPGTPFQDWNFVDIKGRGVYVGDAWTVLNIRKDSWWGEGDEKIYVDTTDFPTHFGTGTEDYYGWAGGVYPVLEDEFSAPFLANVKVGGLDGHTMGYNICTRIRGLDAIPFNSNLRFDMESSFGTDMREKWNLLGYSAVTFFYSFPGATHNRPRSPSGAIRPIMTVDQLQKESDRIRAGG